MLLGNLYIFVFDADMKHEIPKCITFVVILIFSTDLCQTFYHVFWAAILNNMFAVDYVIVAFTFESDLLMRA